MEMIEIKELTSVIVDFKREVYKKIVIELKSLVT